MLLLVVLVVFVFCYNDSSPSFFNQLQLLFLFLVAILWLFLCVMSSLWQFVFGVSRGDFQFQILCFCTKFKIHKFKIKRKESKRIEKKARGVFKCVYRVRERPKEGGQLKDVKKHSKHTYVHT